MKQFDNIRAHRPEGIEDRKAYIIGGGIAGLASAVFLIDDCYVPGKNVTVYDQLPVMGGSMDGVKIGDGKYLCRGERELEPYMECLWYLGNKIPSLYTEGRTITEETVEVTRKDLTPKRVFTERSMRAMCDACKDIDQFLSFMTTQKHIPTVTVDILDWLMNHGFFTAPASTKFHGAHEGGLFAHSYAVTKALLDMTEKEGLVWQKERSPYIVGMFHDLCKIDQYRVDNSVPYTAGEPTRWEYNTDTLLKGHGDKSVMLLSQFYELTEEEILCIRYHMGAFVEKSEWNDYTRAIHKYPNVLWTHQADMIAAHVQQV